MPVFTAILIAVAVFLMLLGGAVMSVAALGAASASVAIAGVGAIGMSGVLCVIARIVQAADKPATSIHADTGLRVVQPRH